MDNTNSIINQVISQNKDWINETWSKIEEKLSRVSVEVKDKIPKESINGVYDDKSNAPGAWTNGFWPGIMWLMYDATGKECFKTAAENVEEKLDAALENFKILHHDVGFMWLLSAGANYMITGNEKSKNRNLHAAAALAARYNIDGGFIKAWNEKPFGGLAIIDCMMNIPLLYWASKETNNIAYKKIAMSHADKTIEHHIRPDGSVIHTVDYDVDTGEVKGYPFTQGYDKDSSWSRGQSWAIYGFVLSYIHTGKKEYLDVAKKVAHYFIANVATTNYIPLLDFRQPSEPAYIDTSAGVIAACGLIEIAKCVPELEQKLYIQSAINIMKAITADHCDWSQTEQSILQHSSGEYHGDEIEKPYTYGEYYYVEAMYKLKGFDKLFW